MDKKKNNQLPTTINDQVIQIVFTIRNMFHAILNYNEDRTA